MDLQKVNDLMDSIEFTSRCYEMFRNSEPKPTENELAKEAKVLFVELKVLVGRLAVAANMNLNTKELEIVSKNK